MPKLIRIRLTPEQREELNQRARAHTVAPRLRHWLATERGIQISTGRLGVLLRRERVRWKRTKQSVRHRQKDPILQDAAKAHLESLIL